MTHAASDLQIVSNEAGFKGPGSGVGEEGQGGNGKSSHWARQDLGDGVSSCRCYPSQVRARQGMDALGEVGYISLCWHFSFLQ